MNQAISESTVSIWIVTSDGIGESRFVEKHYPVTGDSMFAITERFGALNFRLRHSASSYSSNWHVAGDPTLIAVTQGAISIVLRDETIKTFAAGTCFIAQDYLKDAASFDENGHGHRAYISSDIDFKAVHIKLDKQA